MSLEKRVAALEQQVADLKLQQRPRRVKDWRHTIGMFTDNPGMTELFAEAMKLRETDRERDAAALTPADLISAYE